MVGIPAAVAIRAASTFVVIPPSPTPAEPVPPIWTSAMSFIDATCEISLLPGNSGGPSNSPETSDNRIKASACTT